MSASVPFVILVLLLHLGFFLTSRRPDRQRRLRLALVVAAVASPLLLIGLILPAETGGLVNIIRAILLNSPLYMPVLAFLAYLRPAPHARRRER